MVIIAWWKEPASLLIAAILKSVCGNENTAQSPVPSLFARNYLIASVITYIPVHIWYACLCSHTEIDFVIRFHLQCSSAITASFLLCTSHRLLASQSIRWPYIHDLWLFLLVSPAQILSHWSSIIQNSTPTWRTLKQAAFSPLKEMIMRSGECCFLIQQQTFIFMLIDLTL